MSHEIVWLTDHSDRSSVKGDACNLRIIAPSALTNLESENDAPRYALKREGIGDGVRGFEKN